MLFVYVLLWVYSTFAATLTALHTPPPPHNQGTLPVATRCFSTYTTFFGDGQTLSCSPADTCNLNLAGNEGVEVCGSCPSGLSESSGVTTRFGCSKVTKICTCNVPTYSESQCHSNDDCYRSDRSCRLIGSDFEGGFGSEPCDICQTNKMCFLEAGRQAGYCACGLSKIDFATCKAADVSKTIKVRIDSMCLLTSDPNFGSSGAFLQRYDAMRAVPCTRVNQAATFCTSVPDGGGPAYLVTATVTRHGRRLLEDGTENADALTANMTRDAACQDALGQCTRPCTRLRSCALACSFARSEATAALVSLMPLTPQTHTAGAAQPAMRRACEDAYAYSMHTVALLQMEGLAPCMFCSTADFMAAVLADPLLLPPLLARPGRVARLVLRHTPIRHAAEALAALRATTRALATDARAFTRAREEAAAAAPAPAVFAPAREGAAAAAAAPAVHTPARSLLGMPDAFTASGDKFMADFGEMLALHTSYSEALSSLDKYEVS